MKRRLKQKAQSVQVNTITPVKMDNPDFHQYPTDIYTNYGNYAWITPAEAQTVIDVFGKQYVLEGSKKGTYYINPKYMDAEVEALIWRTRGSTPIEGDDKGTYASLQSKKVKAKVYEVTCDDCLSNRDFYSEKEADEYIEKRHKTCKHLHKMDVEKDGRIEKSLRGPRFALDVKEVDYYNWDNTLKHLGEALQSCTKAMISAPKLSPDKKRVNDEIISATNKISKIFDELHKQSVVTAFDYSGLQKAVKDGYVECPDCTVNGTQWNHIIDKQENNYYHKNDEKCKKCGKSYQVARVAFVKTHLTKLASQIALRNQIKDLNLLFKSPQLDKHEIEKKLKEATNQVMDGKINSIINNLLELIKRGSEDTTLRTTFRNLKQLVWPELP